ncbi:MAG: heavy metal translocating P-type ATPase, partial [Eubacteriales bacterium]
MKQNNELVLEGLDCANCAAKIEHEVNLLDSVNKATLNFINKTLIIDIKEQHLVDTVFNDIKKIISKHEPDVIVKEKIIEPSNKKTLLIIGIICASCGYKMEEKIKNIEGVKEAHLNFSTGKLTLEITNVNDIDKIITKAKKIIKDIEPEVTVEIEEALTYDKDAKSNGKLYKLALGILLFLTARFLNIDNTIELILYTVSYIILGGAVLLRAGKNILRGQFFDENFLMSIATIGAIAIGEFPEGVAVMLFYQIGEFFQDMAVNRSRSSIASLMDLRPDYANLKKNSETVRVDPEGVNVGDIIIVKPGERIPLDGVVIEGESMVDTSALTGESVPRKIKVKEEVLSGMINKNGVLTVEVKKPFSESTLAKIFDLVENASSRKAPTEQFISKFARYYTPVVVFSALALALIPPIITGSPFNQWIYRSLVFLVISCPCALVVSIPLGFFGGIGGASKKGILIKGGNFLEALNKVDIAVFDKTGTLTKGVFKVIKVNPSDSFTKKDLLMYGAYGEAFSTHPIAISIRDEYNKDILEEKVTFYDEISGHGIIAKFEDKTIVIGNKKLMEREGISYSDSNIIGTIVHIAVNNEYVGNIIIADEIKEDSIETIKGLKSLGVSETIMLTGDRKDVAESIGKTLSLTKVYSELLPDQKVEKLEMIEQSKDKGTVLFVGDGINDAPVLARADVGIAMGGLGSDAAIEAADVVLMNDKPSNLVDAIKMARRTRRIVFQNIIFALGVKAFFLILGAFGITTMWEAVFADVGVTLIA